MKVVIKTEDGDKLFDSNDDPILLFLGPEDKENIANMAPEANKFCSFPEDIDPEEIRRWIRRNQWRDGSRDADRRKKVESGQG